MAADLDWNPPKGKGGTRPFSNPLLVRPELAKCKATTYDLPGPGHTYGKALERDREDAGAVVASWQVHVKNPQAQPGVDFRTLNRDAIIQGNISAKDNDEFRKHNADKPAYKLKQGEAGGSKLYLPSEGNADYLYGKASRPSTPIEFLMTNSYQRSFVEDLHMDEKDAKFLALALMVVAAQANKCNEFQRLIILRCLRADRFTVAATVWIINNMNHQKFVEPPAFDLDAIYEQSNTMDPLIFVLSTGVDPTKMLQTNAINRGLGDRLDRKSVV